MMKLFHLFPAVLFLFTACGGAIGDSRSFVPNKAPEVRVTAELWTGRDADGNDIYAALSGEDMNGLVSNMTFRLTVTAVDPENEGTASPRDTAHSPLGP